MRRQAYPAISPQKKNIGVNDKFGNIGIKKQQGTTRIIFDSLPLDGSSVYRFFEDVNTRQFPFTNLGSFGNRLQVGESLVVERTYLNISATTAGAISSIITTVGQPLIEAGELNLEIANSQVIKPIPIRSFVPAFNKNAQFDGYYNFEFDTQIVIPPLLEFVSILRTAGAVTIADNFLFLTFEGSGAIIAPRTTF